MTKLTYLQSNLPPQRLFLFESEMRSVKSTQRQLCELLVGLGKKWIELQLRREIARLLYPTCGYADICLLSTYQLITWLVLSRLDSCWVSLTHLSLFWLLLTPAESLSSRPSQCTMSESSWLVICITLISNVPLFRILFPVVQCFILLHLRFLEVL